jgi:hypothetical protein
VTTLPGLVVRVRVSVMGSRGKEIVSSSTVVVLAAAILMTARPVVPAARRTTSQPHLVVKAS